MTQTVQGALRAPGRRIGVSYRVGRYAIAVTLVLVLATPGCMQPRDPYHQLKTISCAAGLPYTNDTWGYGFCYDSSWNLTLEKYGPIVSLESENINVVGRYQAWTSLEEYRDANAQQFRAMQGSEPRFVPATLEMVS